MPHHLAVRRFDRFYTRQIGVLRKTYLDSPFSLAEVRVLYELAHQKEPTASGLCQELGLDPGYLSRTLRGFERRGLISRRASPTDARQSHLSLTKKAAPPLPHSRRNPTKTAPPCSAISPHRSATP
jgi:DNA-binding MarR family transcriptional regulator